MSQRNFSIVNKFNGYRNKTDETNLEADGFLVAGSQNVVSTDGDTVGIRQGYSLYGQAATEQNGIEGSYEWSTHRGIEHALRSYGDELEYYDPNTSLWTRLLNGLGSVDFQFAEYWDTTEQQDILLGVNGTPNIYYWSGGTTTFASATVNTITKQGTTTWAEEGFLTTGTRQVIINGTTYTYTGGESTVTLTGVTPDPSLAGHAVGSSVVQVVRVVTNASLTGLPATFSNDLIAILDNQVWIGSNTSRELYVSYASNYANFSFSSPRLVGEGAIITLDQTPTAFAVQESTMAISAGKDFWYESQFTLSDDLTTETLTVERLKTSPQQSALQQSAVGYIKNYTVFISHDPTLDFLGQVENISTTQSKPISDPIKNDFDSYDFSGAHIKYYKNNLYITVPVESRILVFNIEKGFWESPWILPAGRLAIIDGELYLHSNVANETFKMFQGYSDYSSVASEKLPIEAIARLNYMNGGSRAERKLHDEWYSEGYITTNTELELKLFYDYTGSGSMVTKDITGTVPQSTIFISLKDVSLGKESLGKDKLGGTGSSEDKNKFRVIHEMPPLKYFEIQPQYSSNNTDQYWEVLAYGSNMSMANDDNNDIKQ